MPGVGFWQVNVAGLVVAGTPLCCVQAAAETLEIRRATADAHMHLPPRHKCGEPAAARIFSRTAG